MDPEEFEDKEEAYNQGYEDGKNENQNSWWWIVMVVIILYLVFGKKLGKYDGMSAEEWFNEYDYAEACVSRYADYEYSGYEAYSNCF